MKWVLFRTNPPRYVTQVAGRSDVGGHLITHNHPGLWKVKVWRTRLGAEGWLTNHPGFMRNGYVVTPYDDALQVFIDHLSRPSIIYHGGKTP